MSIYSCSNRARLLRLIVIGFALVLASCNGTGFSFELPAASVSGSEHVGAPIQSVETATPFLPLPTETLMPGPTPTITALPTPTSQPTATWVYNPPGTVTAPILLYHHVGVDSNNSRYYVSPPAFAQQMDWLHLNGYTAVTISTVVNALVDGGDLPPKPVAITFDDGNQSIYTHAFPVMQNYGFVGTIYLVANRLDRSKFLNREQIREMLEAGWEIGSHSMTHADLTIDAAMLRSEVWESGEILSKALEAPVKTFAYPFGAINPFVVERTRRYGYRAAVGLGTSFSHDLGDLFYLNRIEVRNGYDLNRFIGFMPWQ